MHRLTSSIRRPVQRQGADWYILITLLSFASSVTLTRLFLQLTGYPQIGGGEFHIAHVLWGGLLLFIAALLPLVFANRWALTWDALLGGIGVGLFIDEVGKFITTSNNYFSPLAAPIIYALFLVTVMLYQQIRRPFSRDVRVELYKALDALEEILEHDLDQGEREEMENRLKFVVDNGKDLELRRFALILLDYTAADTLPIVPNRAGWTKRLIKWFAQIEVRFLSQNRLRAVLGGGLFALGLVTIFNIVRALPYGTANSLNQLLLEFINTGKVHDMSGLNWVLARMALESSVGLILIIASTFNNHSISNFRPGFGISCSGTITHHGEFAHLLF